MVSDSFFYGLSVSSYGGAIYAAENTTVTLSETSFEQNEADSSGGSVFVEWGTKLEVQGGSFQESSAPEGAAIALCGGVLTGVTITSCNTTEVCSRCSPKNDWKNCVEMRFRDSLG